MPCIDHRATIHTFTDMLEDAGGRGILHFEDTLKGERYVLNLKCQYVRQTKMENGKQLYGFSIFDVDRKLLSYLFFKPLFDENGVAAHPAIDKLFDVASDSEKASTEQSGTDTVDNSVVSGIEEKTEEVDNNTALKGEQVAVEISAKTEKE